MRSWGGRAERAVAVAVAVAAVAGCLLGSSAGSRADTIESALILAYQTNPTLNAQRAAVRAVDENVPQALSGYRPRVSVTATGGEQYTAAKSKSVSAGRTTYSEQSGTVSPYSIGATVTQTLYNGFQTGNRTRQ